MSNIVQEAEAEIAKLRSELLAEIAKVEAVIAAKKTAASQEAHALLSAIEEDFQDIKQKISP